MADKARNKWGTFRTKFKLGVGVKLASIEKNEKKMKGEFDAASQSAMLGKNSEEQALSAEQQREQYLQEGDARLYTSAALKKRRGLRAREDIGLYIRKMWRAVALDASPACNGQLGQNGYFQFNVSLYKALMPDFDAEEALVAAKEDWMNDVGDDGKEMLTFGHFFDSIFELVDVWSPSLEWMDYVQFLRTVAIALINFAEKPPRLRHHHEVLSSPRHVPQP